MDNIQTLYRKTSRPPLGEELNPDVCNIIRQFSQFSAVCMSSSCLPLAQSPICSVQRRVFFLSNGFSSTAFQPKFYQTWRWTSQEVATYTFSRLGGSSDWKELQFYHLPASTPDFSFKPLSGVRSPILPGASSDAATRMNNSWENMFRRHNSGN